MHPSRATYDVTRTRTQCSFYLLEFEDVMHEELLQVLVRVVDAQLLKAVVKYCINNLDTYGYTFILLFLYKQHLLLYY